MKRALVLVHKAAVSLKRSLDQQKDGSNGDGVIDRSSEGPNSESSKWELSALMLKAGCVFGDDKSKNCEKNQPSV